MSLNPCPVCGKKDGYQKIFGIDEGKQIAKCACGLQAILPPPTREGIQNIYNEEYYDIYGMDHFQDAFNLKLKTCKRLINEVNRLILTSGNRYHLDIGCAFGYMIEAARSAGYDSHGIEISPAADVAVKLGYKVRKGTLEDAAFPKESFDLITAVDVLEHISEPGEWLQECKRILKKSGLLLLVTPDCSSLTAHVLRNRWPHYKVEHLYYYSPRTLKRLLISIGFDDLGSKTGIRYLTLNYIINHYRKFRPNSLETKGLEILKALSPRRLLEYPLAFFSEMVVFARKI
ncbi:MAG: class I SAM-dependent methyltransferase [Thermodesulfovibrionales bacterium]|jgi:2-polyprenyl-3-methyl-5-hydroxy-6-metoxy-1,4-benzoquinol methylase